MRMKANNRPSTLCRLLTSSTLSSSPSSSSSSFGAAPLPLWLLPAHHRAAHQGRLLRVSLALGRRGAPCPPRRPPRALSPTPRRRRRAARHVRFGLPAAHAGRDARRGARHVVPAARRRLHTHQLLTTALAPPLPPVPPPVSAAAPALSFTSVVD